MTTVPNTILVTGAMGQLGKLVTRILLDRGRTVVALDLSREATRAAAATLQEHDARSAGRLVPAFVNLLDAEEVRNVVAAHQPGAIVHLAAIVSPVCYKNPSFARRVNVEGTRNLVDAAKLLPQPPFFVKASSSAVYGSRNPHRGAGRVTPETLVNPVECYGEDKVAAEKLIAASGLRHAMLRLGGIISPDATSSGGPEYMLFMRATPRDNPVHAVDARDAALAFANAVDRADAIDSKVLLIGGNESYVLLQHVLQDDIMQAMGIGRLGATSGLPGDPDDDRGWGLTDWFDTTGAQTLLAFQEHDWSDTLAWIAQAQGAQRFVMVTIGPILRPVMRTFLAAQRKRERRGRYANPWSLISQRFGAGILAPTDF
jgi:nucleoside-diphosphate-sugar epimerase